MTNEINKSFSSLKNVEYYSHYLPPDENLYGSSDGLRVKIIIPSSSAIRRNFPKNILCKCHINSDEINDEENDLNYQHEEYDSFDTFAKLERSTNNSTSLLKCCNEVTCLAPHLIVYKLKSHYWSSQRETSRHNKKKQKSDITSSTISHLQEMWDDEM